MVNVVLDSLEPDADKQTLSRNTLTLDGFSGQQAKVAYTDTQGKRWVEDVIFIDGVDIVYLLALRCAPEDLASADSKFGYIVQTWRVSSANESNKVTKSKSRTKSNVPHLTPSR